MSKIKSRPLTLIKTPFGLRKLLPLMLFFMSTIASANWLKISGDADASLGTFIDTDAIRQTGPMNTMRRVWEISNLAKNASNQFLSVRRYREYNCKDRRIRLLEESSFSEHWAKGESVSSIGPDTESGSWQDIAKGGIDEIIFKRVCPNDDSDATVN